MSLNVSAIFITPKVAPFDHIKPMTLVKANMRRDFSSESKDKKKITGNFVLSRDFQEYGSNHVSVQACHDVCSPGGRHLFPPERSQVPRGSGRTAQGDRG